MVFLEVGEGSSLLIRGRNLVREEDERERRSARTRRKRQRKGAGSRVLLEIRVEVVGVSPVLSLNEVPLSIGGVDSSFGGGGSQSADEL